MAIEGEDLGAELYQMRVAGTVTLPSVAAVYAQGTRHMHNSSWRERETFEGDYKGYEWRTGDHVTGESELFQAPVEVEVHEGKTMGPVYYPWTSLRDTAQRFMGNTSEALSDAGAALNLIANAYAAQDGAAADRLDELSERNADDLIAPTVPEVKGPYDPHDTRTERERVIELPGIDIPWEYDREVLEEEPINPLGEN